MSQNQVAYAVDLAVTLLGFYFLFTIFYLKWRGTIRFFGYVKLKNIINTLHCSFASPKKRLLLLCSLILVSGILFFTFYQEIPVATNFLIVWSLISTVTVVNVCAMPPGMLFLTASGEHSYHLLSEIKFAALPVKVSHCLIDKGVMWLDKESLRLDESSFWLWQVHRLCDTAKIILVDASIVSYGLKQEITHIIEDPSILSKTVFLGTSLQPFHLDVRAVWPASTPWEIRASFVAHAPAAAHAPADVREWAAGIFGGPFGLNLPALDDVLADVPVRKERLLICDRRSVPDRVVDIVARRRVDSVKGLMQYCLLVLMFFSIVLCIPFVRLSLK